MTVPDALRQVALEQWMFAKMPDWPQVQTFFRVVPLRDLKPLDRNTALVTQLRANARGQLMHDLLRLRAEHGTNIETLPDSAATTPSDAILDVLSDAGD